MRRLQPHQTVLFLKRRPSPPPRAKVFIAGPADAREAFIAARQAEKDAAAEKSVRYVFELCRMLDLLKRGDFNQNEHDQRGSFE